MNRIKTSLTVWMLGCMVLAGLTACSGSDDEPSKADDGVKVRRLTITETDGSTRASLVEGDDILNASWTAGDKLTYCNMSMDDGTNVYSGELMATTTAAVSQFTGDVTCRAGDYLAVVYPATTFEYNDRYTLSLAGQDGTLSRLATNYHYVFGKAHVTAVTDKTADATMPKMKSLLTVCKFSFMDTKGDAIPIQTLTISYGGGGSDGGTYPQSATVNIGANTEQSAVHASGVDGTSPLTITCSTVQEAVYVALLPTTAPRTFRFTVSDGNGNTYTGTAKATLVEGEYVEATGLKLTKQ